ncbi:MAG TPA: proline dehydrogenase family protein [Bryobacteraceae bacterium]
MLRRSLLYLSEQPWLRRWMEHSPVSRKLTSRFVAGRTLADAIGVLQKLSAENILGTLDHLGENVNSLADASESTNAYLEALAAIEQNGLPATISIKLTQLGLNFSEQACRANLRTLAERARVIGCRIEVDMESSAYTDRTLRLVTELHSSLPGHVRAVIQAYLHRSESDVRMLSARGIPVRLCKGAYQESISVAFARKAEVDANYVRLMKFLLAEGVEPAIATHNASILRKAVCTIQEQNTAPDRYEFQMLYGIRRDLQRDLVRRGFRLRLYVPYGDAWYPYFMRRLAERPANALFLAKNVLRR